MADDKTYRKRLREEAREEYLRSVDVPALMESAEKRRKRWRKVADMIPDFKLMSKEPPIVEHFTPDDYIDMYRHNITDQFRRGRGRSR